MIEPKYDPQQQVLQEIRINCYLVSSIKLEEHAKYDGKTYARTRNIKKRKKWRSLFFQLCPPMKQTDGSKMFVRNPGFTNAQWIRGRIFLKKGKMNQVQEQQMNPLVSIIQF